MTAIKIGPEHPVYFIAEIGANHEGNLSRACWLIDQAAKSGASAVKFQHYRADTLASESGFEELRSLAHYSDNPYRVFRRFEVPLGWTPVLAEACRQVGVDFLSTPYDLDMVDHLDPYVKAFKIGSGDITYHKLIEYAASKGKPMLIATGASTVEDLDRVFGTRKPVLKVDLRNTYIMQCNTNYDVGYSKTACANLEVLRELMAYYPAGIGYSDHTLGYVTALGAVALGAKIIEKHFTDDRSRPNSPDHPFATEPHEFQAMVEQARKLEAALGDGVKKIEDNERDTVILQRRCLRAARDLPAGHVLTPEDVVALRPAPTGSVPPYRVNEFVGKKLQNAIRPHGELYEGCVS